MSSIIHHADCFDILPLIDDNTIDLIICDLPYGLTKHKWDKVLPLDQLWHEYKRIIKSNGAILLFGMEPFSSKIRLSNMEMYRYDWYWKKNRSPNFLLGNKQPLRNIEVISVFYKSQPTYNPQKTKNPAGVQKRHLRNNPSKCSKFYKESRGQDNMDLLKGKNNSFSISYEPDMLLPKQLIEFKSELKVVHPTQKPLSLLSFLIKTYSNEKDIILDNCMGSGSTGVAAKLANRGFIGIEKQEDYFLIAKNRLESMLDG